MRRLIVIAMALVISLGIIANTRKLAIDKAYNDEYDSAARTLRLERAEIESELNDVNQQLKEIVIGKGCYTIVFEELYHELFTDVVPLMRDYGFSGVMALSTEFFPGNEDCITVEEYDFLMRCGWGSCVYWDGLIPLSDYMEKLNVLFEKYEIPVPEQLYVEYGEYNKLKNDEILSAGFSTVIHHGEDEEIIARENSGDLFHIGAMAWNYPVIRDVLDQVIEYGGSMVIYSDFSSKYGMFQKKDFEKMLKYLTDKKKDLYITDLDGLKTNLSMATSNEYLIARKEYLQAELERYDTEIQAIYRLDRESLNN